MRIFCLSVVFFSMNQKSKNFFLQNKKKPKDWNIITRVCKYKAKINQGYNIAVFEKETVVLHSLGRPCTDLLPFSNVQR